MYWLSCKLSVQDCFAYISTQEELVLTRKLDPDQTMSIGILKLKLVKDTSIDHHFRCKSWVYSHDMALFVWNWQYLWPKMAGGGGGGAVIFNRLLAYLPVNVFQYQLQSFFFFFFFFFLIIKLLTFLRVPQNNAHDLETCLCPWASQPAAGEYTNNFISSSSCLQKEKKEKSATLHFTFNGEPNTRSWRRDLD